MAYIIRLLVWLSGLRWAPRIISGRGVSDPYLTRHYLIGGPATEGMYETTPGRRWGLYLHHFHRSDDAAEYHSHPWAWAIAFVLKNGYTEDRLVGKDVHTRVVRPGTLNVIRNTTFHRVDLHRGDAWTLFLVGPRVASWGFLSRETGKYIDWRTFCALPRDEDGRRIES
jgi:hypothetical protein